MRFSDVLGNNILGVTVQAIGSFKDIGGQVVYLNQRRRLNWGAAASHIPFLQLLVGENPDLTEDELSECRAVGYRGFGCTTRFYRRIYLSQVAALGAYPLSQTRRFEGNVGYRRIGYGYEYDALVPQYDDNGNLQGFRQEREGIDAEELGLPGDALHLAEVGGAYVGDYSFFGFTSPVRGGRYRFGVEGTAGSLNYATATADYRRYLFVPPFLTVAARALHYGRYGPDADSGELFPIYLGYGTLVRGYRPGSFEDGITGEMLDRLYGNRIGLASVELRLPFLGTSQYGLIEFPYLPTELVAFADAGMAWGQTGGRFSRFDPVTGEDDRLGSTFSDQTPLFSAGASARVNVLGALILEFYYAFPFSRDDDVATVFGVNLSPGW